MGPAVPAIRSPITQRWCYHPSLIPGASAKEPCLRHAPQTIQDLRTCLRGYPPYMKVEVKRDVPVVAKTVGDLRSLSTWPPGLVLNFPRPGDRHPKSVVEVERAS
jgi:hypothetical protein